MPVGPAPSARGRWPAAVVAVVAFALASVLASCGLAASGASVGAPASASGSASGVVDVVAAENVWGDIARQIGGSAVHVTSIITDPGTDPHEYETDPAAAAALSRARIVVVNGAGYDDFAMKLLRAGTSSAGASSRTVVDVASLGPHAGSQGGDINPHLWYDPTAVRRAASAITTALAQASPAHATAFAARHAAFLAAYQAYVDELATIKARYAGTPVAYTERVPGYLIQAAGLVVGSPAGFSRAIEDGDDPSVAQTAAFDEALTSRAVRVLLYNGQVVDPRTQAIRQLAERSGVPVVAVTETLPTVPAHLTFQAWQLRQAQAVLRALETAA